MSESMPSDSGSVIEVSHLTFRFGSKMALDDVTLSIPRGVVYGLVGENGAGKTTLIKLIMGFLTPKQGTVRVFGLDPTRDPVNVLKRVGYLSEDREMPGWMRIHELMAYIQAFYPGWDEAYAEELRKRFELDPAAKVKALSRGERAKAALLIALAYRPELLVLDEPSSGLDPVVRREILSAIIRTVADEGRTVFFSSHLLEEVERVTDHVAMIQKGKIVLSAPLDTIKCQHRKLVVRLPEASPAIPPLPGVLFRSGTGREQSVICDGRIEEVRAGLASFGAEVIEETVPSLDEIFVARVSGRKHSKE